MKLTFYLLYLIVTVFLLLEISARLFMNYNNPFDERWSMKLLYEDSPYGTTFSPNQIIYKTLKGKIQTDSITYKINQYNQRGDRYNLEKSENEIRIVFVGGSHIFDMYYFNYDGGDFSKDLENKFINKHVKIINAGVPGHTLQNITTRIEKDILKYNPDIVIINSIWNDLKIITRYQDSTITQTKAHIKKISLPEKNPLVYKVNIYDTIFGYSVVYRKIRDYYWSKKMGIGLNKMVIEDFISSEHYIKKDYKSGLSEYYEKSLLRCIKFLKENNIMPILAIEERLIDANNKIVQKKRIQYGMINITSHNELVNIFNQCDSVLYGLSSNNDIYLFNVNNKIPHNLDYFSDHVHTTKLGSQFMANEYFKYLSPIVDSLITKQGNYIK